MKPFSLLLTTFLLFPITFTAQTHQVAITFDDLPFVHERSLKNAQASTEHLLRTLKKNKVPVVGFVNESKLFVNGDIKQHIQLLEQWLTQGHELGNHTYGHVSFNITPLVDYEADVLRGNSVTKLLCKKHGSKLRYFRYPFLQTGPDSVSKYSFQNFLQTHHYQNAPVTVDNEDYIFSKVYVKALTQRDTLKMKEVTQAYLTYVDSMFAYFERQAMAIAQRPIRHILLCHANQLNADHFQQVINLIKARGYAFVTLEEALKDPIYTSPEQYVGKGGFSWLHRWRKTKQLKLSEPEPEIPAAIMKEYEQ